MAQGTTKGVPIDVDPLLDLNSDLVVPSQKAIKAYVDAKKSAADSDYINVSGDTMTGYLLLHADPSTNLHAVTKQYVDNYINGLDYKTAAHVGTVAALPAYSISVNKLVLTGTSNGAIPNATFDNHAPLAGERVLVKNETSTLTPNNGIYVLTQVGDVNTPFILTRADDANTSAELGEATLSIINGDTLSNTIWHCTPASVPITIGTTNLTFIQVGSGSVGTGVANELTYWASASSLGSLTGNTTTTKKFLSQIGDGSVANVPAWGPLLAEDIPNLSAEKITTGTLAVARGGTNLSSYTIGDLLYADGTTSLAKLAGVGLGSVLISGGVGAAPSWSNSPKLRSIVLDNASNANTLTLQSGVTTTSYTITLPTAAATGAQYLQTTGTGGTLQWASGTTTGVSTIGTYVNGTGRTNGALIAGSVLTFGAATATLPGMVDTGSQTFAGAKTFSSDTIFSGDIAVNGATSADITTTTTTATLFNANATTLNIGGAATTSTLFPTVTTLNLGNTATAAQTVNMFGASTGASTYNFAHGVTASATTKIINIGTLGGNNSTTSINLGSAVAGALGTVAVQGGGSGTVPNLNIITKSSYSWIRVGTGTGAFPTNDVTTNTRSTGDRIVFSDAANTSIGYLSGGSQAFSPTLWLTDPNTNYALGGSSINFTTNRVSGAQQSGGFNFFVPNFDAVTDDIGFGTGISSPTFTVFRAGTNTINFAADTGIVIRSPRRYIPSQNKNITNISPSTPSAGNITVTLNSVAGLSVNQVVRITGVVGSTGYNNIVGLIGAIGANTIQLGSNVTETYGSAGVVTPVYAVCDSTGSSSLGIFFDKNDVLTNINYAGSLVPRVPNLTPVITFRRTGFANPTETFELLNHSSAIGTLNFGTFFNSNFNFATNASAINFGAFSSTINIGDCRLTSGTVVAAPVAQTINIGTVYSYDHNAAITRNINIGYDPSVNSGVYSTGTSILNINIGRTATISSRFQVTNIGFYGATPVPKGTTANITGLAFVTNSGTAVNSASTFGGYTLAQIAAALQRLGLIT